MFACQHLGRAVRTHVRGTGAPGAGDGADACRDQAKCRHRLLIVALLLTLRAEHGPMQRGDAFVRVRRGVAGDATLRQQRRHAATNCVPAVARIGPRIINQR